MPNPDLSTVTDEQLRRTAKMSANPLMWELAERFRRQAERFRRASAIASAAREAGMVDEVGRFRKILGTLPITADGCVAGHGANLFMTTANAVTDACAYTTVLLCETKAPNCVIPRYYAAREAAEASLAERIAARSAAEAAKGGGDAQ